MPENDTALLVMDVQSGIAERFEASEMIGRLKQAIAAAREHDVEVIYVRIAFRRGYPEVSPRNRSFGALAQSGMLIDEDTEIHPEVAPQDGEVIVTKKRVSAFAGSDLEVVLRARGIRSLVLSGISTSGVVLSTTRAAADMDFELTVLGDCCADADPEVHRVLLEKVLARQAEVIDAEAWAQRLGAVVG